MVALELYLYRLTVVTEVAYREDVGRWLRSIDAETDRLELGFLGVPHRVAHRGIGGDNLGVVEGTEELVGIRAADDEHAPPGIDADRAVGVNLTGNLGLAVGLALLSNHCQIEVAIGGVGTYHLVGDRDGLGGDVVLGFDHDTSLKEVGDGDRVLAGLRHGEGHSMTAIVARCGERLVGHHGFRIAQKSDFGR